MLKLGARNANALPVVVRRRSEPSALRRLEVVNLFAYRTPHPSLLKQAVEPIGKDNDRHIKESVEKSNRVILAWGNHGTWRKRDLYTLKLLKKYNHLYSLGMTKKGCPRHPLYLRSTTKPQIYDAVAF